MFKVALIWPPLSERFGYYRFGPRLTVMALGYLEAYIEGVEGVEVTQINIDKTIHSETDYWKAMDYGGLLKDDSIIEQYINGEYQSEIFDELYDYLFRKLELEKYDLLAVSYDVNYIRDRYSPVFFKMLSDLATIYKKPIILGGLGSASTYLLKIFKRYSFIKYMSFGTIDSINLKTFRKIVLLEKDGAGSLDDLENVFYRDNRLLTRTRIYKGPALSSEESSFILKPRYHLTNQIEFRTKYSDIRQYDNGFPEMTEDDIEIPIIPYRMSVGCVNNCAFCMSSAEGRAFAFKKVEDVAEDIERLIQENNSNYFMFLNSMINFSKSYVDKLCNTLVRRNIKICFTDSAEISGMDRELLTILKEMGGVALWYGLECPSNKLLSLINKPCKVEDAIEIIKISNELGFWVGVNLIAGLPHENDDDILQTVQFIKNHVPYIDMWQVTPFYLVRSKFLENPLQYGIIVRDLVTSEDKGEGDLVMATFDEVNGMKWEDKQQKSVHTFKLLLDTIDQCAQVPNISNASFIFYAYTKFGNDKRRIREWLTANYRGKAPTIAVTGL